MIYSSRTFRRPQTAGTCWCTWSSRRNGQSARRSAHFAETPLGSVQRSPWRSRESGRQNCRSFQRFRMEAGMSETSLASIRTWLAEPMNEDVSEAIERLRRAPDVEKIAVMPDVHLAADVCIGVVVATSQLVYPQAVGGDIGCGVLAVGFDIEATA